MQWLMVYSLTLLACMAAGGEHTTAEPEPESESEPEPEPEPESEPEPEPEDRPHPAEIVVPPFAMIACILLGLAFLSVWSRMRAVPFPDMPGITGKLVSTSHISLTTKVAPLIKNNVTAPDDDEPFLSAFDKEVIGNMNIFSNRPSELLRVAAPALLSLALCPTVLYLYVPLVDAFWPPERFSSPPEINEAIACFLAPAGLVYATSFGFAFQLALHKQGEILQKVSYELGLLDQIVTMTSKLSLPTVGHRMAIYRAVKAEAIFMALQIVQKEPQDFRNTPRENVKVKLWEIFDILRSISRESEGHGSSCFDLDRIIADTVVVHMLKLNSICSDRMGVMHARIHPLKWAFLESLGFFAFFGILLIRAESYRLELVMCVITVFSISLMCYVVSDLDSPFSGFFRIDTSVLADVVYRMQDMFDRAKAGNTELSTYQEKGRT